MFARSFLFIVLPSPPARLSSFSFSVGAVSAEGCYLVGCSEPDERRWFIPWFICDIIVITMFDVGM